MKRLIPLLLMSALSACRQAPSTKPMPEQPSMMAVTPVNFMAEDGLTVHGHYYRADAPKALILLFHQANSSKGEYASIAPMLVEEGYSALAIDQRSGGAMFGTNQTAAGMQTAVTHGDALHDLEAALSWSRKIQLPVIVRGSSYSSALVFQLAAKRPKEVAAILAFSPGEYLGPGNPVATAAAKVTVPVFVTVASDPKELAGAKPIFDAVAASGKKLYVPTTGIHGSLTLIADRNAKGAAANWMFVDAFLASVAK
jgi:alpha-beta hydrolase superfamily lysophospholipase